MDAGLIQSDMGAPSGAPVSGRQYLRLSVGDELYVVPIDGVREILEVGRMTVLPMTPDFVHGVMNLRGAVVPVIDLQARFGFGRSRVGRRSCIVVVEAGEDGRTASHIVGTLVDGVSEVLELSAKDIEPPPPLGTRIPRHFIAGMAHTRGQLYTVLDLPHTLAEDEMAALIAQHVTA